MHIHTDKQIKNTKYTHDKQTTHTKKHTHTNATYTNAHTTSKQTTHTDTHKNTHKQTQSHDSENTWNSSDSPLLGVCAEADKFPLSLSLSGLSRACMCTWRSCNGDDLTSRGPVWASVASADEGGLIQIQNTFILRVTAAILFHSDAYLAMWVE